jgi:hypothetical protein
MDIDRALDAAIEHYLAGDLYQAESIYKKIFKKEAKQSKRITLPWSYLFSKWEA